MLNREQDFDLATPMLHHDTFVGRVVQALALSRTVYSKSWPGLAALYNTTPLEFPVHANRTDLKLHLQILPSCVRSYPPDAYEAANCQTQAQTSVPRKAKSLAEFLRSLTRNRHDKQKPNAD